jgi:DNA-binding NarL/FixJ family response regulator
MKKAAQKGLTRVCLLSGHPMVLSELERVLKNSAFQLIPQRLESTLRSELRNLQIPKALIYIVDVHVTQAATGALLSNILDHYAEARIIVVAGELDSAESYFLLKMGAKGLLTFEEAREQLPRALSLVASGGYWVPRRVLSGFVDSTRSGTPTRCIKLDSEVQLTHREQEVFYSLLEYLSNKEIGIKLNISARTVKFHVSNVLRKFGVRRRADLDLVTYMASRKPYPISLANHAMLRFDR